MAKKDGWLEHRDLILCVMENKYAKYAEMWKDEHDDRVLVSNIYRQVTNALKELNDDDMSVWTRVAVNKARNADEKVMDRIIDKFTNGVCKDASSSAKEG